VHIPVDALSYLRRMDMCAQDIPFSEYNQTDKGDTEKEESSVTKHIHLFVPLFVTTLVTLERVWFGIIVIVDMEGYNPRSKLN
jgi:hypothetical protein